MDVDRAKKALYDAFEDIDPGTNIEYQVDGYISDLEDAIRKDEREDVLNDVEDAISRLK